MKKLILLSILFIVGCLDIIPPNYHGEPYGGGEAIYIYNYEQDVMSPDKYYIYMYESLSIMQNYDDSGHGGEMTVKGKQLFKKQLYGLMQELGYVGFHIRNKQLAGAHHAHYANVQFVYEIHFHKTEEDFDKWDVRYKD